MAMRNKYYQIYIFSSHAVALYPQLNKMDFASKNWLLIGRKAIILCFSLIIHVHRCNAVLRFTTRDSTASQRNIHDTYMTARRHNENNYEPIEIWN